MGEHADRMKRQRAGWAPGWRNEQTKKRNLDRRETAQVEAEVRQTEHDKRTPNEQIALLDFGGHDALKERTLLSAWVNDGLGDTPINVIRKKESSK